MVKGQPGLEVSVSTEPLKSAFEMEDLKLCFNECPQAFPEPETALKIERRSRYDRLGVWARRKRRIFFFSVDAAIPIADAMRRQLESWSQDLLGPDNLLFRAATSETEPTGCEVTEEWVL